MNNEEKRIECSTFNSCWECPSKGECVIEMAMNTLADNGRAFTFDRKNECLYTRSGRPIDEWKLVYEYGYLEDILLDEPAEEVAEVEEIRFIVDEKLIVLEDGSLVLEEKEQ